MKFPRLPEKFDHRKKLMMKDIKIIRKLRKAGKSVLSIARKFHVSPTIIYYWTNNKYRQYIIEKASKIHRTLEIKRMTQRKSINHIRKDNPNLILYARAKAYEYYKKHKK